MRRAIALAGVALALAPAARLRAQKPATPVARDDARFSFYDRGPYRPGIPTPESLLGYPIGERNTQYAEQERTLLGIADAAKDRVRVEEFTTSYERRTMRLYIVSAPENIARLDAIRRDLDRLADPRGAAPADIDALTARVPAVVWISGSVHGNESPGFETCMQLLYQLAASDEPATLAALKNTIVIVNPSSNPDGHERFTVWYNSVSVGAAEPRAMEHNEPWSIYGRYNHYRFDMNRDLVASTQREVQGIMRMMLKWHPMVAADLHGQVSTYFFPPAARPINANIVGDPSKWLDLFGHANAAAFDRYGWMYYSRDIYDLYYPGYYDTWPSLNGAIGMTFETDGGGHRGVLWRRADGTLLSLRDGIAKHFVASLATIETTSSHAAERVRDYLAFRRRAVSDGRSGPFRRVIISPAHDPARAAELVSTLLRAGVEVRRASAGFSSARAHAYADDAASTRRFDAGAFVVDLDQPQGKVAKAILEPAPTLDSAFARTQVAKFERNQRRGKRAEGEQYEFYDVTAWSLPVAFGVDAYWTDDASPVAGELISLPTEAPAQQHGMSAELTVDVGGIVAGRGATSAYLFSPERNGAPKLAYQLLAEGFRVAVASQPLDAGGRQWPRGTYVLRIARNDSTLTARIDALARASAVEVSGVNTAQAGTGQYGIGSETILDIPTPNIAVIADEGVSQTDYGATWFSLERRYGVRFTPLPIADLDRDLSKYTAILLPSGRYTRVSKEAVERIRTWVRSGGTLVTMGSATAWAAEEGVALTSARRVAAEPESAAAKPAAPGTPTTGAPASANAPKPTPSPEARDQSARELIPYQSTSASNDTPESVPGIHADVLLDRTHWLTAGYDAPRLTVLVDGDLFLRPSKEGENVAVFPTTGPLVRAGFTWPGNTERLLRGTALLVDEPIGAGHVVLFANEPLFRGSWRALDKLVLNALVLGAAY